MGLPHAFRYVGSQAVTYLESVGARAKLKVTDIISQLCNAAAKGDLDVIEKLINMGLDPNTSVHSQHKTRRAVAPTRRLISLVLFAPRRITTAELLFTSPLPRATSSWCSTWWPREPRSTSPIDGGRPRCPTLCVMDTTMWPRS